MKLKVKEMRNIIHAAIMETVTNNPKDYSYETRKNISNIYQKLYESEEDEEIEIEFVKPFKA